MTGTQHLVVMGVAGCGKSTTAPLLARRLGWRFAEGDTFHPAENVEKMASGHPLSDEDRQPWLEAIRAWITDRATAGESSIVTCSALRRAYRDLLRQGPGRVRFVHLHAPQSVIAERVASRGGHFMPVSLLPSQFQALEPLGEDEDGVVVDVGAELAAVVDAVLDTLRIPRH